jgi:hypothetical protein
MYVKTVEGLEDRFGDQHLVTAYSTQLKTRNQIVGESLQQFATTIKLLTHPAFPALHENYVHRGPGKAFGNGIRY